MTEEANRYFIGDGKNVPRNLRSEIRGTQREPPAGFAPTLTDSGQPALLDGEEVHWQGSAAEVVAIERGKRLWRSGTAFMLVTNKRVAWWTKSGGSDFAKGQVRSSWIARVGSGPAGLLAKRFHMLAITVLIDTREANTGWNPDAREVNLIFKVPASDGAKVRDMIAQSAVKYRLTRSSSLSRDILDRLQACDQKLHLGEPSTTAMYDLAGPIYAPPFQDTEHVRGVQ